MTAQVNGTKLLFEIYFDGDELSLGVRSANGQFWERIAEGKRRDG